MPPRIPTKVTPPPMPTPPPLPNLPNSVYDVDEILGTSTPRGGAPSSGGVVEGDEDDDSTRKSAALSGDPAGTINNKVDPKVDAASERLLERFANEAKRAAADPSSKMPGQDMNENSYLHRVNRQMQEKVKKLEEELQKKWQQDAAENKPKGLKQRIVEMSRSYDPEAKRKKLMEEAFHDGYFDEIKELAKKGEKWWDAEAKMVPAKRAVSIPNIVGRTLTRKQASIHSLIENQACSLVAFVSSELGARHVMTYITPALEKFENTQGVKIVQVNNEDSPTKAFMLRLSEMFIRRRVPAELHDSYILNFNSIREERKIMGITNRLVGWVHLVDSAGRIRWNAHGPAKPDEIANMLSFMEQLSNSSK
ncbi:ATP10 protein-domain-containing protein [Cladochytrium replicatum]|nr:ATP10 protein-domain-containing protein [Cladochytrium replicatum]